MKYLVIGPGAIGVYALFGLLKKLEDTGQLDDLVEISASSAGALAAFCLLTKMKVEDALKVDAGKILKLKLKNLLNNEGLIDPTEALLVMKQHSQKTFRELYDATSIKFHVAAFSIEKLSTDYLSVDNVPDMLVADAVMSSMSIPLMFPPFNGYLDGSLMEELPSTPFAQLPSDDILAVRIVTRDTPVTGLLRILTVLLKVCWSVRTKYQGRVIDLALGDVNLVDFKTSHDSKIKMYLLGYQAG